MNRYKLHLYEPLCKLPLQQFRSRSVENLLSVMALKNQVLAREIEHMSRRTTREKLLSYLSEQSIKAGLESLRHREEIDLFTANIELAGMEMSLVNAMGGNLQWEENKCKSIVAF